MKLLIHSFSQLVILSHFDLLLPPKHMDFVDQLFYYWENTVHLALSKMEVQPFENTASSYFSWYFVFVYHVQAWVKQNVTKQKELKQLNIWDIKFLPI